MSEDEYQYYRRTKLKFTEADQDQFALDFWKFLHEQGFAEYPQSLIKSYLEQFKQHRQMTHSHIEGRDVDRRQTHSVLPLPTNRVKPRSDNSDKHPYTKPSFWVKPENWFWNNDTYTPRAKEYFEKFVVEQDNILNRKWK